MEVKKAVFGKTADGQQIDVYTLTNKKGMIVKFLNYGGTITHLFAPARKHVFKDVILGYDDVKGVLADRFYMGSLLGRYANRIGKAEFALDGQVYHLARNNNGNSLHGGDRGFNRRIFTVEQVKRRSATLMKLSYLSKDGEEGYPGNLEVAIYYSLNERNEFSIEYTATTDKQTVINLSNHMYFNLSGDFDKDILEHYLEIAATRYTPTDSGSIPTGKILQVRDTPLDFCEMTKIGERIGVKSQQLEFACGYDQNFVLNKLPGQLELAASIYEMYSGRILDILTTEPAIQFYSGNFLDGKVMGKDGKPIKYRCGLCLEPQHFPDSPNQPGFPSTVLDPGKQFKSKTIYRFSSV